MVAAQEAAKAAGRQVPFCVRLLEVGASGGLNLRPHHVGYRLEDTVLGDADSLLVLDPEWTGRPPADLGHRLRVVGRAGCDLTPVDVSTEDGRLHLSSFVWADQLDRWNRLRDALDLAATDPVKVDRSAGPEWLANRLARAERDVLTVVWHSVVWQYVSPADRAMGRAVLADAAAKATPTSPLALLVFEPRRTDDDYRFELLLKLVGRDLAEPRPRRRPRHAVHLGRHPLGVTTGFTTYRPSCISTGSRNSARVPSCVYSTTTAPSR